MVELLNEWGSEILFGLVSAAIMGYAKWHVDKLKKELDSAKQLAADKDQENIENTIEIKLEPIYQELEDLRKYIRETATKEKTNMSLIIASYRFRLVQLCKGFLNQGYITSSQMESLMEFYKLYSGLGGNGQAKIYVEKVMELELRNDESK